MGSTVKKANFLGGTPQSPPSQTVTTPTILTGTVTEITWEKASKDSPQITLHIFPDNGTSTTKDSLNPVKVYLLAAQSNRRGGTIAVPRIGDEIMYFQTDHGNHCIGSTFKSGYTWPFSNGEESGNEESETNEFGGNALLGTGMRIPDQPITMIQSSSNASDQTDEDDTTQEKDAKPTYDQLNYSPGAQDVTNALIDPETNFLVPADDVYAEAEEYEAPTVDESSNAFKNMFKHGLTELYDPAYESGGETRGLGFNEILIKSRVSKKETGEDTKYAKEADSNGGISLYGQDFVDTYCSGNINFNTLQNTTINSGKGIVLESSDSIILRVGRSSLTLSRSGVSINQDTIAGLGSSLSVSKTSIESFSVSNEIKAWNYAVEVPWATFNLAPMNGILAAAQGVEIKSGFANFAPFTESLAEYSAQAATLMMSMAGADSEEKADLESDLVSEAIMVATGVPTNMPLSLSKSLNEAHQVPPGGPIMGILGPSLAMLTSVVSEGIAIGTGKGGSSTVKLHHADVTIQAGYVEQIPYATMAAQFGTAMTELAMGVTADTVDTQAAKVGTGIASAIVAVAAAGAGMALAKERPLAVAGNGNVRIEASQSVTSGAYIDQVQTLSASTTASKSLTWLTLISGGSGLGLIIGIANMVSFGEKAADASSFVGLTGTGMANTFVYHSKIVETKAPTMPVTSTVPDPVATTEMTEILLEGPTQRAQHEMTEAGEESHEQTNVKTKTSPDGKTTTRTYEEGGENKEEVTNTSVDPFSGKTTETTTTSTIGPPDAEGNPTKTTTKETETVTSTDTVGNKTTTSTTKKPDANGDLTETSQTVETSSMKTTTDTDKDGNKLIQKQPMDKGYPVGKPDVKTVRANPEQNNPFRIREPVQEPGQEPRAPYGPPNKLHTIDEVNEDEDDEAD